MEFNIIYTVLCIICLRPLQPQRFSYHSALLLLTIQNIYLHSTLYFQTIFNPIEFCICDIVMYILYMCVVCVISDFCLVRIKQKPLANKVGVHVLKITFNIAM